MKKIRKNTKDRDENWLSRNRRWLNKDRNSLTGNANDCEKERSKRKEEIS